MNKWGITSVGQFILINIVFACAGMLIVYERKPIFDLIGITSNTPFWIKVCVYIPLVFPLYQFNLLVFGFIFGQFPFFWEKEKKMFNFIFRRRTASNKSPPPSPTHTSSTDRPI